MCDHCMKDFNKFNGLSDFFSKKQEKEMVEFYKQQKIKGIEVRATTSKKIDLERPDLYE